MKCHLINFSLLKLNVKNSHLIYSLQVERDRNNLLTQTFKQLNTYFNRRTNTSGPPLCVHRVKVTFKEEPGEGSGVARSFYTAVANAVLSQEKLPPLDSILVGGKTGKRGGNTGLFHI